MRFVSCLCSVFILASVHLPGTVRAAGLYEDFFSFFPAADTSRTLLVMRHAEIEHGAWRASLLTGELDLRVGRLCVVRYGFEFPAVRTGGEIDYGMGDIFLRGAVRVFGDTLDASGLFLRSDLRIPSGSKGLRPFCNASLDAGAGFEARLTRGAFAARGAALYTLVGARLHESDFENDNNLTLAVSLEAAIPAVASVTAASCTVRFHGGAGRQIFLCSLDRSLSQAVVLGIGGAVEVEGKGERIFDSAVSLSLAYRFPPRAHPAIRKSTGQ